MLRILIAALFLVSSTVSPAFASINHGNGSTFDDVTVYRGNGSIWGTVDTYRGNGSTWDQLNTAGGSTLKDSNTDTYLGYYEVGKYANFLYVGGNFTTTSAYTLTSVEVYLARTGTATGTLTAAIYATSSGAPTGSALAVSNTVDRSTIPTTETAIEFDGFSLSLSDATEYCIILYSSEVNGDETVAIYYSDGGGTYLNEMYNDADGVPPFTADNDKYVKFATYGY